MGILTEADKSILPLTLRGAGGFHHFCRWYLRGFDPLPYQYAFHQAAQQNVSFVAGIASGKTTIAAASYLADCITIPYFRALNTSVTAKQAELPFEMAQTWIEGNDRLLHLIDDISLRPYPTIKFCNGSEWVFRTAGKDARYIRGMEFDRINYDECGLDFGGEAVKILRGRLRGVRPDGTQRMSRLDAMTSPTDAPWLFERWMRGIRDNQTYDPRHFLSMRVSTWMNTRLDPEQIALMQAEYSDDMIAVELGGEFPDYGASMFAKSHVHACTNQSLNDAAEEALHPETGVVKKGYRVDEHPRYGVTHFELPADPRGLYIMGGDPGTDGPPKRNAGVVLAARIDCRPAKIVYFDWVFGMGSYNPFLASYKYAMDKYHPALKGMDTTGTQKAIDELAFENMGLQIDGLAFNRDKDAMLNCLIDAVTNHDLTWPLIRGLVRQMSSYSRENDKKLTQDIVMAMAEIAFLMRFVDRSMAQKEESKQMHQPQTKSRMGAIRSRRGR